MWFVLSLIFVLLVLTVVLSFPAVQTRVAKYAANWLNKTYDTRIELAQMRYIFPDEIVLKEVYLPDDRNDTLIYASQIDLHLHGFNSVTNTAYSNGVEVDDLKFYWLTYPGDTAANFIKFVDKFKSGDTSSSKPFNLKIADVKINNGIFQMEELGCNDCFRLFMEDLNIDASAFDLFGSYLTLDVNDLNGRDRYSVNLKQFAMHFGYLPNQILIDDVEFTTAASYFDGSLSLNYKQISDFKDFVNKVEMVGEIEESDLNSQEIQLFGEEFPDFGQFAISGSVNGPVNSMQIKDVVLDVAGRTHLEGNIDLKNTTTPENLFLHATDIDLKTNPDDAQFVYGLFADTLLPSQVKPLGDVHVTGNFNGYLNNFTAIGHVETDLGELDADLYLFNPDSDEKTKYKGDIELRQFNLGKIIGQKELGLVSSDLFIDGSGLDPTTMNTKLNGKVSLIEYNKYGYKNITVDGKVAGGAFNGLLKIQDPNLRVNFNGKAGFEEDTSKYNFTLDVLEADLYALNFVEDTIAVVTGEVDIDFTALNYDKWAGDIRIHNSTYENSKNFHFFQDITIHSEGLDTNKSLKLRSNILDVTMEGNYTFSGIADAVQSQVGRFVKTVKPVPAPTDQNFEFVVDIKNSQILTDILMKDLFVDQNSHVTGNYSSGSSTFKLVVESPTINYKKMRVKNIDLNFEGSPNRSQLGFSVANFNYKGFDIDSINLGNFYYNDTLFYDLRWILKDSIDSRTNLLGYAIQEDTTTYKFGVFESAFNVGLQKFKILGGNEILMDTSGVHIENLVIRNKRKAIYINGNISENPDQILRLNIRGFGMDVLNYFIGSNSARFSGKLGGDVLLTELLSKPKFAADLNIDSLEMNEVYLGDFSLNSDWAVQNDTINLEARMKTGELTTFIGKGYYQPDSLGDISLDLNFNRFKLAAFNPFLDGLAENLRGYANGKVSMSGNTGAPKFNGELELPQTAFTISLLQTDYNFVNTPKVKITPAAISFPGLKVRDTQYGTQAQVEGKISHNNFADFKFDIHVKADELLVLNTTSKTEDPYYGTAFVSGDIDITGPLDEILVSADVISARNTKFYLPIDGATEVDKTGFVTFVDYSKKEEESEGPVAININKGVTIDFKIEVDQNADVAIIVDSDAGNQLESKGVGNIRLIMKPYSDLEMYGTYTVIQGYYNFVLPLLSQNLLNRKFDVLRGGSVTWNGDPLGALISLTARYTTKADPSALLAGATSGGPTLTILDLYLSGELTDPEIRFDLSAPRAPSTVQSAISNQVANQDNLYTQVFSILALNRFAPPQGLELSSAGRSLGFSALTSQAASYINLLTGDYQVSLDYQEGDQNETVNEIGLRSEVEVGVSKRFLDNRFVVSTSLGVAVDRRPDQRQFASDAEIEYNITEDGRFRAKAFNRPVQDQYNFGQQNYQQGLGVYYRIDFNTLRDLWEKELANNGEATKEEEEEVEEEPGKLDDIPQEDGDAKE